MGGKTIPQATLEAMAQYSKQLWPDMTTFVRVVPSWLAAAPVTYTYLDAGWLQYAWGKGDVATMVAAEVAAAKSKRLGLMVGLNVLQGGNGSSGIRGTTSGNWAMSASEVEKLWNHAAQPELRLRLLQLELHSQWAHLFRPLGHQDRHGRAVHQGQGSRKDILQAVTAPGNKRPDPGERPRVRAYLLQSTDQYRSPSLRVQTWSTAALTPSSRAQWAQQ